MSDNSEEDNAPEETKVKTPADYKAEEILTKIKEMETDIGKGDLILSQLVKLCKDAKTTKDQFFKDHAEELKRLLQSYRVIHVFYKLWEEFRDQWNTELQFVYNAFKCKQFYHTKLIPIAEQDKVNEKNAKFLINRLINERFVILQVKKDLLEKVKTVLGKDDFQILEIKLNDYIGKKAGYKYFREIKAEKTVFEI